ncbi:MAG: hypothetical protein QGH43_06800 [Arenicellales bacterium]|nr:hypothetical protein [Arenicellales bacterium]MDP6918939.1 hypothetical protein [Arenicellales bacterium]
MNTDASETAGPVCGCFEISASQYRGAPDPSTVGCERVGKSPYCRTLCDPAKNCFAVGGSLYCSE